MIDTLGSRLNSGFCLKCGAVLMIVPWNDYQCCADCTKVIEGAVARARGNKTKLINRPVILRQQIARQVSPLKDGI